MIEKIKHACLKLNNKYYLDMSHELCYKKIVKLNPAINTSKIETGFMTNKNRFVNRIEGAIIAFNSGQLDHQPKLLFSEHFWSKIYLGNYNYNSQKGYYKKIDVFYKK